jgi:hypothetical protein
MPAAPTSCARRWEAAALTELVTWARQSLGLGFREIRAVMRLPRVLRIDGNPVELTVPSPVHRSTLDSFQEIRRLLATTFVDADDAASWPHREVPLLGGRRLIELIQRVSSSWCWRLGPPF